MKFLTGILDLIYPVVCINCGNLLVEHEKIICTFCVLKLPVTNFHTDPANDMAKAMWGRIHVDFATAYLFFRKAGITQKLLHQLKYKERKDIGIYLGNRLGKQIKENYFIQGTDFLIPVPLHASKQKIRGYNQSQLICEGLQKL